MAMAMHGRGYMPVTTTDTATAGASKAAFAQSTAQQCDSETEDTIRHIHGRHPWEASMGGIHGQHPWEASMGSIHGQHPWEASMGSIHRRHPWAASMGGIAYMGRNGYWQLDVEQNRMPNEVGGEAGYASHQNNKLMTK